jgi:hypothetical protein
MSKFKVGDRVQATEDYVEKAGLREPRWTGTVSQLDGVFPVTVDLDPPHYTLTTGLFYEHELEPYDG